MTSDHETTVLLDRSKELFTTISAYHLEKLEKENEFLKRQHRICTCDIIHDAYTELRHDYKEALAEIERLKR